MNPISLEKEAQETFLPHLYKDISVIKISPEEQVTASRSTYTFINKI